MTWRLISQYQDAFLAGFGMTVKLSLWSLGGSLVPGIILLMLTRSHSAVLRAVGFWLVAVFRNIPSVVQLFMIYYILPLGLHVQMSAFTSAVVAFILNGSGYVTEILRSGLDGLPKGQWEAARALGIRGVRLYTRIILPQAAVLVIGPFLNEVTRQVKSSSLASTIAVKDVMYVVAGASSDTFAPMVFFSVGAVFYFMLIFPFSILGRRLERRTFQARAA